jgi:carbonic anhydrase
VQVNYAPGSSIKIDGVSYELKQFHFHAPSENLIKGKSYALEAHLVHADKDGHLAVLALMFQEGAENKALARLWPSLPAHEGEKHALDQPFQVAQLLPAVRSYYRFSGSLTTPPCTEGVRWLVMKRPLTVSHAQVEMFTHLMHHPNNRPVQAVNARELLE